MPLLFGHLARAETKKGLKGGNGMAVAALVLGYLTLLPALWMVYGIFGAVASS